MNNKQVVTQLVKICSIIDELISHNQNYTNFKIGKTADIQSRETDYQNDGFNFVWEIANGNASTITFAEKELIKYFTQKSPHKDKCINEQIGGGSNNATHLYIAIKANDLTYEDLLDDTMPLSNDLPIELDKY